MHSPALLLACLLAIPAWSTAPPTARSGIEHPVHASLTELSHDPAQRSVQLVIRVFADDLAAMLVHSHDGPIDDGVVIDYLSARFVLYGSDRKQIVLRWGGMSREQDLISIRLAGDAPAGLTGGSLRAEIGFELFPDQVNILKARYGGREHTLLFRIGGGVQRLP